MDKKPYPRFVCYSCGNNAQPDKEKIDMFSSYHMATCEVCGRHAPVTEPRDFGYPIFKNHEYSQMDWVDQEYNGLFR